MIFARAIQMVLAGLLVAAPVAGVTHDEMQAPRGQEAQARWDNGHEFSTLRR
jgi:hypothetical protein